MWIIVRRDSKKDSLVIEITIIIFEKEKTKLTSTIITIVNMMSTCCIKIKIKS